MAQRDNKSVAKILAVALSMLDRILTLPDDQHEKVLGILRGRAPSRRGSAGAAEALEEYRRNPEDDIRGSGGHEDPDKPGVWIAGTSEPDSTVLDRIPKLEVTEAFDELGVRASEAERPPSIIIWTGEDDNWDE